MTCDSAKKAIPLYIYGELPPETEEHVEEHIAHCHTCAEELEHHRAFARALNSHELEPSLDLLVECRQSLALQLNDAGEMPGTSWWQRIFGFPINNFRVPASAMALIALGWFGARLPVGNMLPGAVNQAGLISTVRSIEPDASGRILISVDDTQRRVISGGVSDDNIRKLLLTALHEQSDPGIRVESASVLKDYSALEDVRNALLDRLQHDPNPGVRLKALDGLQQFAYDPSVRRALTTVLLSDSNSSVRIQAIDLLTSRHDGSMAGIFQSLVRKDDNNYVRMRCERALQEMNASLGTF